MARVLESTLWVIVAALSPISAHADAKTIFRCELDGVPTFSDRPCASGAESYVLQVEASDGASTPSKSFQARPRSRAATGDSKKQTSTEKVSRQRTCDRIAQALEAIRAKYRSGYTAEEAQRLKQRESKLKAQLRNAKCG